MRLRFALLLGLFCLFGPPLVAQTDTQLPLIRLSSFLLETGEDLAINASDLNPGSPYRLELVDPNGQVSGETVEAAADGSLETSVQFDVPGRWQLAIIGDRLDFSVNLEVEQAADSGAAPSEPEPSAGNLDNPGSEPSPTESGAADESTQDMTLDEAPEQTGAENQADTADEASDQTEDAGDTLSAEPNAETPPVLQAPTDDSSAASEEAEPSREDADSVTTPGADGDNTDDNTDSLGAGASDSGAVDSDADNREPADAPLPDTTGPSTGAATPTDTPDEGEPTTSGATESGAQDDATEPLPTSVGERAPLEAFAWSLGRAGWYGVTALLLAILALHLTLAAKYWRAQSVNLERRRILERPVSPWSRALIMRYYSLTEKLVFVLLLVAVAALASLAAWYDRGASGPWLDSVNQVFISPWAGLTALRPGGLHPALWILIVILFLLVTLVTLAWLFIPRLRWVGNSPRSMLYHLLSVLVPGSGLADEMWGLLLIIPWALFGLDALAKTLGWGIGLGLSLRWDIIILSLIYLVNLIAVIVEFMSYSRRMRTLKQENPELAREFGLLRADA